MLKTLQNSVSPHLRELEGCLRVMPQTPTSRIQDTPLYLYVSVHIKNALESRILLLSFPRILEHCFDAYATAMPDIKRFFTGNHSIRNLHVEGQKV